MLTVACVLRASREFDAEYVERLQAGVAANLDMDHRFVCLSDVPVPCERMPLRHDWPGWWAKMELFDPAIKGDLFYLDLDTIVTGPLDELASAGRLTLLKDFWQNWSNTGVMYLPEADRAEAWQAWIAGPAGHMASCGRLGDGKFLRGIYNGREAWFQDRWPGQIVSYKTDVMRRNDPGATRRSRGNGTVPDGARLICFHGKPRPRDVKDFLANAA